MTADESYWESGDRRATVHHGDSLLILPTLAADSVDLLLTDPPYSSGGQFRGDRTGQSTRTKYQRSDVIEALPEFSGDTRDQRGYLAWCSLWLAECLRITRPGGYAIVYSDWRQLPTLTDAIQAAGWVWRGIIPWHKPNHRRRLGGFSAACEYVVWATNGPVDAGPNPIAPEGFLQASSPPSSARVHIAEKPLGTLRHLIQITPRDGVVLDPFFGSGNVGIAALNSGRRFVGIEITEHYAQVGADRLAATARGYQSDGLQTILGEPA